MWTCPFCGSAEGIIFRDSNLKGMLCMDYNCGRFHEMDDAQFSQLFEEKQSMGSPV